jgi:signal transduction histidine kinase
MKTEIEVMLRDKKPEIGALREQLESNLEEIAKLESLSTGLLQLAKYTENDNSLELAVVNLEDVAHKAQDRLEKAASHRAISIKTDLNQAKVSGDTSSLIELTAILIDNAIKYSAEGSEIKISTSSNGRQATLSVQDHGVGIAVDDLPHIFDRFYQADTSRTKQKSPGYGLGLSLAKAIAERHHGNIVVDSEVGQGTKVSVQLPAVTNLGESQNKVTG